jgi:hypothetical protein
MKRSCSVGRVVSGEFRFWQGEQAHMFNSMRHAGHVVLVAEAADIAVQGGARLVNVWVVDEQNLQLIRQAHRRSSREGVSRCSVTHSTARLRAAWWAAIEGGASSGWDGIVVGGGGEEESDAKWDVDAQGKKKG